MTSEFTEEGEEGAPLSGCKPSEAMLRYIGNQYDIPSVTTSDLVHSIRVGNWGLPFHRHVYAEKKKRKKKSLHKLNMQKQQKKGRELYSSWSRVAIDLRALTSSAPLGMCRIVVPAIIAFPFIVFLCVDRISDWVRQLLSFGVIIVGEIVRDPWATIRWLFRRRKLRKRDCRNSQQHSAPFQHNFYWQLRKKKKAH